MVFRIPSDVIKPSGYRPRVLYMSSGILNTVDPLASASNLYLDHEVFPKLVLNITKFAFKVMNKFAYQTKKKIANHCANCFNNSPRCHRSMY